MDSSNMQSLIPKKDSVNQITAEATLTQISHTNT